MDNNILNNAPFWSSFIAMLCAQALKPFISLFSGEGWKPKLVISNGGMPSSHTAAVSALAVSIGIRNGFASDIFVLSFVFLLVVMNDAMNVRLETEKHSVFLNEISELLASMNGGFSRQNFRTMVGHTTLQVFWGMLIGIALGCIITLWFFK